MLGPLLVISFLVTSVLGGTSGTNAINSIPSNFGGYGPTSSYVLGYGGKGVGYHGLGYGDLAGYGVGNDLEAGGYGLGYGSGYGGYAAYGPGLGGYGLPYGVNAYKYGVSVPVSGAVPWGAIRSFGPLGYNRFTSNYKSADYGPGLYSSAFYR